MACAFIFVDASTLYTIVYYDSTFEVDRCLSFEVITETVQSRAKHSAVSRAISVLSDCGSNGCLSISSSLTVI